jgi:BMFP domain-containing protein YqiC
MTTTLIAHKRLDKLEPKIEQLEQRCELAQDGNEDPV